jgi:hypothetical protein
MLPSGIVVRLSDAAAHVAPTPSEPLGSCLYALAILKSPNVIRTDDNKPVDVLGLSLRDVHVLRAFLTYAGLVPEEMLEAPCDNCGTTFHVKASSLLEVGPFVDCELGDPDLDAPFKHDEPHSIPRLLVGKERARTMRIHPRVVRDVLPLWHAETNDVFRFTPAIVTAMGITAIGRERRATVLADAITRAPTNTFRAIADLVYQAQYSPRLVGAYRCTECGARNDVDVLSVHEIPYDTRESRRDKRRPFPDINTFETMVRDAGKRVYRQRGVRNIDIVVDDGVAECDDGGEPILGCYTPSNGEDDLGVVHAPEIRIFYRTFGAAYRDEPSFDVCAEIDETIDHEVVHHLHFLSGDDPLDDEERDAIAHENIRRVGKRESARRASKLFVDDITGFFRTAWPLLLVVFVAFVTTSLGFFRCR